MWPKLAAYFGVEPQGPGESANPLAGRMQQVAEQWKQLAAEHNLAESDINKLATWWHTDGDLGRTVECVNDMSKSRRLGFTTHQDTFASFTDLFARMQEERLIPPVKI